MRRTPWVGVASSMTLRLLMAAGIAWALPVWTLCAGQGGGQGGGQSSGRRVGYIAPKPPVKVTLVRIVDSEGNVDYQIFKDAEGVAHRRKVLEADFEQAGERQKKMESSLNAKGLKSERQTLAAPIVDVLRKDVPKSEANDIISDAKDWAVYEIAVNGRTRRVVSYAHSDAFARAIADTEYARAYNQWVKAGKTEGQEPAAATVSRIGSAMAKKDAEKAMLAKEPAAGSDDRKPGPVGQGTGPGRGI